MNKKLLIILVITGAISCKNTESQKETVKDAFSVNIDSTINPADDFFDYANGKWIKDNPIPSEESSWGIGYMVINETQQKLREISEDAAKEKAAKGSASQKIGDFWLAAMDSVNIQKQGIQYLKPYLDQISAIKDIVGFMQVVGELNKIQVPTVFESFVIADSKNSDQMAFTIWQGGIGLPEREYYFNTDLSTLNIRNKYTQYMKNMLVLLGDDSLSAGQSSVRILSMETAMAKVFRKLADVRDSYANYNKFAITDLKNLSSSINWKSYLNQIGVSRIDSIIVGQPEVIRSLDGILKNTSIEDLKNYLRFQLISNYAVALPDPFINETFAFKKLFSGAKEMKPRWKRVIQAEEGAMGELLGQLYVKKYFDSTTKKRYSDLVEDIREAYRVRITNLTWMSDSTKQKALAKLNAMGKKVGYPDHWKDFSEMEISKESFVQNLMNANKWSHNRDMAKLGKPVDRTEWEMTPQTYNAYYNPFYNEIVLPAGIFSVPGFKDAELDDALVYGYSGGSTIGHEITHGFDDQGRLFDDKGNLKNWWSPSDSAQFTQRAKQMIKQFDGYEPLPGVKINGAATLGENIADLGGILLGIDAFKKSDTYKKNDTLYGRTPMQRFFLGYALGWLYSQRKESLRNQLMTDVHSPAKYRVNGPYSDVDEFYTTYGVSPKNKMFITDSLRVKIW